MKVQSTFGVGGQTLKETYVVSNLQDAKKTAEQINPIAKIVAMNTVCQLPLMPLTRLRRVHDATIDRYRRLCLPNLQIAPLSIKKYPGKIS